MLCIFIVRDIYDGDAEDSWYGPLVVLGRKQFDLQVDLDLFLLPSKEETRARKVSAER